MPKKSRRVKFMEEEALKKKTRGDAIREGKRKAKLARERGGQGDAHLDNQVDRETDLSLQGRTEQGQTYFDPQYEKKETDSILERAKRFYRFYKGPLGFAQWLSEFDILNKLTNQSEEMKKFEQGLAYQPPAKEPLATEWVDPNDLLPKNGTIVISVGYNDEIRGSIFYPDEGWVECGTTAEFGRIKVKKWLKGLDPKVLDWGK